MKPQAKMYMQTPLPHYDKMVILYGKDRAIGNYCVTALELRKRSSSIVSENFTESTYNIDPTMPKFLVQNTAHSVGDDVDIMPPSTSEHVSPNPHGIASGNKKSRKSIDKENEVVNQGMKDTIEKVMDTIKTSGQPI